VAVEKIQRVLIVDVGTYGDRGRAISTGDPAAT